ncbi:MAG: ABC transporter ATP-binding protein [Spirochaetaceae bacterium]
MLLNVQDLTKIFRGGGLHIGGRKDFLAVDNVDFSIEKSTIFGLVGESGSGKTTVARNVLFLERPTSGKILFNGTDLNELSKAQLRGERRKMQIIFQDPNASLNPKLTIKQSMEEGLKNRGVGKEERERRVDELLETVGISSTHKRRYPHEFSGGQKQRIIIARALSMDPDFLILDEPVSNLDVSIQAQVINLLLELKEKFSLTYLFISHDLNLISYLSDTIAVMFAGRIVEMAPTEAIIEEPRHPYTIHLFSSVPGSTRKREKDQSKVPVSTVSETPTEAARKEKEHNKGCSYFASCPRREERCREMPPELQDLGGGHYAACFYPDSFIEKDSVV